MINFFWSYMSWSVAKLAPHSKSTDAIPRHRQCHPPELPPAVTLSDQEGKWPLAEARIIEARIIGDHLKLNVTLNKRLSAVWKQEVVSSNGGMKTRGSSNGGNTKSRLGDVSESSIAIVVFCHEYLFETGSELKWIACGSTRRLRLRDVRTLLWRFEY